MATIVFEKEEFLKQISAIIEDEEYIIFTNDIHGTISADTKRIPAKRVPFAFNEGAFARKGGVKDILQSKLGAFSVVKFEALSDKFREEIETEKAAESKRKKMSWISVNDELPKESMACLVYCTYWGIIVRPFNKHHNCWDDEDGDDYYTDAVGGKITHWQPLPEKP